MIRKVVTSSNLHLFLAAFPNGLWLRSQPFRVVCIMIFEKSWHVAIDLKTIEPFESSLWPALLVRVSFFLSCVRPPTRSRHLLLIHPKSASSAASLRRCSFPLPPSLPLSSLPVFIVLLGFHRRTLCHIFFCLYLCLCLCWIGLELIQILATIVGDTIGIIGTTDTTWLLVARFFFSPTQIHSITPALLPFPFFALPSIACDFAEIVALVCAMRKQLFAIALARLTHKCLSFSISLSFPCFSSFLPSSLLSVCVKRCLIYHEYQYSCYFFLPFFLHLLCRARIGGTCSTHASPPSSFFFQRFSTCSPFFFSFF